MHTQDTKLFSAKVLLFCTMLGAVLVMLLGYLAYSFAYRKKEVRRPSIGASKHGITIPSTECPQVEKTKIEEKSSSNAKESINTTVVVDRLCALTCMCSEGCELDSNSTIYLTMAPDFYREELNHK